MIRPEEKALLSRLVNIMVALELRIVQEKAEDGQSVYRLDPYVLRSAQVDRALMPATAQWTHS